MNTIATNSLPTPGELPLTVLIVGLWIIGTAAAAWRAELKAGRKSKIFELIYFVLLAPTAVAFAIRQGLNSPGMIALSLGCVFGPITLYLLVHYYNCKRAWQLAPALHTWLIENFALLDADGDGLVNRDDIDRVWYLLKQTEAKGGSQSQTCRNDRKMAGYAGYFLCDIGHVTSSILVGSPMAGAMTRIKVYGMNLADVEAFPEKALLRYQREFPRG
jgi:hypothetical protein